MGLGVVRAAAGLISTQEACFEFLELAWRAALLSSQILGLYPLSFSQGTCLHDLPTPQHPGQHGAFRAATVPFECPIRNADEAGRSHL